MGIVSKLQKLKSRLGANGPGITIAVIALVFALVGGAFAASGGLTSKQKKQVTAIAKKEAEKVKGTPGPAGPQGSPGSAGTKGDRGEKGPQGDQGLQGQSGESVAISPISKEVPVCEEQGGIEVRLESEGEGEGEPVCNGKEGSPWTAGGTLPSGATETGSYSFSGSPAEVEVEVEKENPISPGELETQTQFHIVTPISFGIPLAAGLDSEHVHFESEANFSDFDGAGEEKIGCKGTYINPAGNPATEIEEEIEESTLNPAGNLCVYRSSSFENAESNGVFPLTTAFGGGTPGARRAGAVIDFSIPGDESAYGIGSFAVTAP